MDDSLGGLSVTEAVGMTKANVASEISMRVLAKQQSVERDQGEAALALIAAAAESAPAADPTGVRGTRLDVTG
ncbi:MAG: hypothetical protein ACOYN0_11125 [Phycisphaerales bacterium]